MNDIPPEVARRAVQWQVDLQSGTASDGAQQALQDWLAIHPDHRRAWDRIEAVNRRLSGLTGSGALVEVALAAAGPPPRRLVIRTLGAALLTGGLAWQVERQTPWREWLADERTGVGERRTVWLDDGSTVALNTDTAIELHFDATERRLHIVRGEVLVTTGHDLAGASPPRPIVVHTRHGALRPLGTRFAVRQQADSTRVDVFEGAVSVHPRNMTDGGSRPAFRLEAGQQVRFTDMAIGARGLSQEADLAWVDGMLVASGMRLEDFLRELGRHRPGGLRCDPAVAHLRVSGTYPLDNTDRVLDLLSAALPVEVRFLTRWWVTVVPRSRNFSGGA